MKLSFKIILLFIFLSFIQIEAWSHPPFPINYEFEIQNGGKKFYSIGDTLKVNLIAIQNEENCLSGVDKSKIFLKGLKMIEQQNWEETDSGNWEKRFSAVVVGNKSNQLQITAYRNTDKGKVIEVLDLKMEDKL